MFLVDAKIPLALQFVILRCPLNSTFLDPSGFAALWLCEAVVKYDDLVLGVDVLHQEKDETTHATKTYTKENRKENDPKVRRKKTTKR